jgi:hypothetical protein
MDPSRFYYHFYGDPWIQKRDNQRLKDKIISIFIIFNIYEICFDIGVLIFSFLEKEDLNIVSSNEIFPRERFPDPQTIPESLLKNKNFVATHLKELYICDLLDEEMIENDPVLVGRMIEIKPYKYYQFPKISKYDEKDGSRMMVKDHINIFTVFLTDEEINSLDFSQDQSFLNIKFLEDFDFIAELLEINNHLWDILPDELFDNRKFILTIKLRKHFFQDLSPLLKEDKEIYTKAVDDDPTNLQELIFYFDNNLVRETLLKEPDLFDGLHERIELDRSFVEEFIKTEAGVKNICTWKPSILTDHDKKYIADNLPNSFKHIEELSREIIIYFYNKNKEISYGVFSHEFCNDLEVIRLALFNREKVYIGNYAGETIEDRVLATRHGNTQFLRMNNYEIASAGILYKPKNFRALNLKLQKNIGIVKLAISLNTDIIRKLSIEIRKELYDYIDEIAPLKISNPCQREYEKENYHS